MKKIISILLGCIMLAGAPIGASAADAGEDVTVNLPIPVEKMPVAYYGTPVIDAVKDDCYNETSKIYSGTTIKVNCTAKDGSRGYAWMCWDNTGLYVFAEIDEETPACVGKDQYQSDGFEIFLDEDLSRNRTPDDNDAQYRVTIEGKHSQGLNAPTKFEGVARREDAKGKYYIELKAPWLEIVPAKDTVVGFDIQVNDGDSNGQRTFCAGWWSERENNWQYTDDFGAIRLDLGDYYPKWDGVSPVKVSVNSKELNTDGIDPIIENDRTIVPMRTIFEALGAGVTYNAEERAAYVIGNKKLIIMPIGSNEISVNGETVVSDVPLQIKNDRLMVPLRFVSELLDAKVTFDNIQGAVFVNK